MRLTAKRAGIIRRRQKRRDAIKGLTIAEYVAMIPSKKKLKTKNIREEKLAVLKHCQAVARLETGDIALPSSGRGYKIYREPDREPVDKLAASMFWKEPKI